MPTGATRMLNDFYVDDLVTGVNTIQELIIIRDQINVIANKAGFYLRKWFSNHVSILEGLSEQSSDNMLQFDKNADITTLGLQWNPNNDVFSIDSSSSASKGISKQTILLDIAHIFNLRGLLGPVIIIAKILIQKLWQLKIDWD